MYQIKITADVIYRNDTSMHVVDYLGNYKTLYEVKQQLTEVLAPYKEANFQDNGFVYRNRRFAIVEINK